MPVKKSDKKTGSKKASKVREPKKALELTLDLNEWDLELVYLNKAETFSVWRATRDGYLGYDIIMFEDATAAMNGDEPAETLYVRLDWSRKQDDGDWAMRLVGNFTPF